MISIKGRGHVASAGSSPLTIEAEQCSVCGKRAPNEDYALFERNVGMCVADGIGGAPLGDAVARYACHIAMATLRDGGTAYEAVEKAGECVRRFVTTVESPRSGTSIVVARMDGNVLEASWAGDSAIFVLSRGADGPHVTSSLESDQSGSEIPLNGTMQVRPGSLSEKLAENDIVVLCTDGTWRNVERETIAGLMSGSSSPREIAARLVLDYQPDDDSTALVARLLDAF